VITVSIDGNLVRKEKKADIESRLAHLEEGLWGWAIESHLRKIYWMRTPDGVVWLKSPPSGAQVSEAGAPAAGDDD
jgi:hypothetical protein